MNKELLTKDAAPYINITPLIDVLLVLLIIFMVVSPLKPARFQAAIPREPKEIHPAVRPNDDTLVVAIKKDLQLKLNGESELGTTSDAEKLATRLAIIFSERKENHVYREGAFVGNLSEDEKTEKTVFIKAPRSIAYGDVVKVMDAVKGAGANPIGLQIDDLSD